MEEIIVVDENGDLVSTGDAEISIKGVSEYSVQSNTQIKYGQLLISLIVIIALVYFGFKTFIKPRSKISKGNLFDDIGIKAEDVIKCTIVDYTDSFSKEVYGNYTTMTMAVFELSDGEKATVRVANRAKFIMEMENNQITVEYKNNHDQ